MISRIIDEKNVRLAKALIDKADNILIVSHMSPDGDAVGSALAASHVLTSLGKEVKILVPDNFLGQLKCLPGARR